MPTCLRSSRVHLTPGAVTASASERWLRLRLRGEVSRLGRLRGQHVRRRAPKPARPQADPRGGARALGGRVSDEGTPGNLRNRLLAEGAYAFLGSFSDITRDLRANNLRANNTASEFIHSKIRAIVKDRETAEKLVPRDHP